MKWSHCVCPACGTPDEQWTFVEGIVFECDNCGHHFEDLNAAWWFTEQQDEFWDLFWESFRSTGRR